MIPNSYELENLVRERQADWEQIIHNEVLLSDSKMKFNLLRRIFHFIRSFKSKKKASGSHYSSPDRITK